MVCIICSGSRWLDVDSFRYKPQGMSICADCGFITYPERASRLGDLHDYYEKEYRIPSSADIRTGRRKLDYHAAFLDELLRSWTGLTISVFDVGAATGVYLDWIRDRVSKPTGVISGCELNEASRIVAKNEFDLDLTPWFDDSRKWDLITHYQVAEHMPNIRTELGRYRKSLSTIGRLYISAPAWWKELNSFGGEGFNFEDYLHPDHINVWTEKHFKFLLESTGFKIEKENHTFYGSTYLCAPEEPKPDLAPPREYSSVLLALNKAKEASDAFMSKNFARAIELWPAFPQAHIQGFPLDLELKEALDLLNEARLDCPASALISVFASELMLSAKQYGAAIHLSNDALTRKPGYNLAFIIALKIYIAIANDKSVAIKDREAAVNEGLNASKHLERNIYGNETEAIDARFQLYLAADKIRKDKENDTRNTSQNHGSRKDDSVGK